MSYLAYASSGALIKRSIAELVRAGLRVDRVAHDPPAVTFRSGDGVQIALRFDGPGCALVGPAGTTRFYDLEAALAVVTRTVARVAS